jgi:hypothetical protein
MLRIKQGAKPGDLISLNNRYIIRYKNTKNTKKSHFVKFVLIVKELPVAYDYKINISLY